MLLSNISLFSLKKHIQAMFDEHDENFKGVLQLEQIYWFLQAERLTFFCFMGITTPLNHLM